jgi:hypothetical protein
MQNAYLMFDVVIFADTAAQPATRTLLSLVEGVVADMVKRVILVSPQEHPDLVALADAAGCQLITIPAGATNRDLLQQSLSTDHALCLSAGSEMPQGWPEQLKTELRFRGMPGSAVVVMFRPEDTWSWLKLTIGQSIKGSFNLNYGALVPQRILLDSDLDSKRIKSKVLPVQMSKLCVRYQAG